MLLLSFILSTKSCHCGSFFMIAAIKVMPPLKFITQFSGSIDTCVISHEARMLREYLKRNLNLVQSLVFGPRVNIF